MKLNSVQHVKFGVLSTVLVLATIMLTTIDVTQTSVFAQNTTSTLLPPHLPAQDGTSTPTTPALVSSGSNDDESSSSDESNNSNNDENNESTGSSGSGDDDDSGSQDTSSSDDDDSGSQDTSSSEEEEDETEDDSEQTNPLLGQIRDRVNGALSASGMPSP